MNFDTFVKTYLGKAIDYDGGYGVQCVDAIKLYADKVLGLKFGAFGNAHAYYDNYTQIPMLYQNFTRIMNTPDFVPQRGDIVVWNKRRSGGNGHVAIATGIGDTKKFHSFDMNWDGKGGPLKEIIHDYTNVSGVLRPNKQINVSTNNSKFQNGQKVLLDIPVIVTGNRVGNGVIQVNSNGYYFFVHESVVKNNRVYGLATVCCPINSDTYIVQVFDKEIGTQFNCKSEYMSDKF